MVDLMIQYKEQVISHEIALSMGMKNLKEFIPWLELATSRSGIVMILEEIVDIFIKTGVVPPVAKARRNQDITSSSQTSVAGVILKLAFDKCTIADVNAIGHTANGLYRVSSLENAPSNIVTLANRWLEKLIEATNFVWTPPENAGGTPILLKETLSKLESETFDCGVEVLLMPGSEKWITTHKGDVEVKFHNCNCIEARGVASVLQSLRNRRLICRDHGGVTTSKLELRFCGFLEALALHFSTVSKDNFQIKQQHRFSGELSNKPYDLAILKNGALALLVELDGGDHFKARTPATEKFFTRKQEVDAIKTHAAVTAGVPLFRVDNREKSNTELSIDSLCKESYGHFMSVVNEAALPQVFGFGEYSPGALMALTAL